LVMILPICGTVCKRRRVFKDSVPELEAVVLPEKKEKFLFRLFVNFPKVLAAATDREK